MIDVELFVGSLVVLRDESEVEGGVCMEGLLLLVRCVACLSRENNIYSINNIFKSTSSPDRSAL